MFPQLEDDACGWDAEGTHKRYTTRSVSGRELMGLSSGAQFLGISRKYKASNNLEKVTLWTLTLNWDKQMISMN